MLPRNRSNIRFAMLGLAITVIFAVYQLATDPLSSRDHVMMLAFTILCPASLLSIPVIDAEVGTSAFYFLWTFIGLLNAALYGTIAVMISKRRRNLD